MNTRSNPTALQHLQRTIFCKVSAVLLVALHCSIIVSAQSISTIVKIDTRLCYGSNVVDAAVVVFDAAYSNDVDGDDAYKFSNTGENLAIQRGTALLVVEGRQPATANDVIPFKVWNLRQLTYRLEFTPANFAGTGMLPILEDTYLHTTTPISREGTTSVDFTVTSNTATSAPNRFRILFTAAAPLPVKFVRFTAKEGTGGTDLDWTVASQLNIQQYEAERSADGKNFYTIGSMATTGNSNVEHSYHFTAAGHYNGTVFYRVKSLEKDGTAQYSSVVKLVTDQLKQDFVVLSNPVTSGVVPIQFINQPAGVYTITLLNAAGHKTMSNTMRHTEGTGTELIRLPATVMPGVYWLQVVNPANEAETKMILISNP